jgi:hypothetical protein
MKSFAISALLSVASAQTAVNNTIAYNATLNCGMCINGGFNYCLEGADGQVLAAGAKPSATCCADGKCAQASNATFTCSNTYADKAYALTFCPQSSKCGTKKELTYTDQGVESFAVKNLTKGETCTYKLKSDCGSPAFKVNGTKVNVTYIEFETAKVNKTNAGKGNATSP